MPDHTPLNINTVNNATAVSIVSRISSKMKFKIGFILLTIIVGVWSQENLFGELLPNLRPVHNDQNGNLLAFLMTPLHWLMSAVDNTAVSSAVDALNRTIDHI
ncbi:uncharacterized protein LOC142230565 isoform X1 [Haematobia irritans]|uniref:uncharacterized protein LOC142230565 isoform X1 n=1 Tax=Haematobia irritans TaxID=7368 RepID=UPI003F50D167